MDIWWSAKSRGEDEDGIGGILGPAGEAHEALRKAALWKVPRTLLLPLTGAKEEMPSPGDLYND